MKNTSFPFLLTFEVGFGFVGWGKTGKSWKQEFYKQVFPAWTELGRRVETTSAPEQRVRQMWLKSRALTPAATVSPGVRAGQ